MGLLLVIFFAELIIIAAICISLKQRQEELMKQDFEFKSKEYSLVIEKEISSTLKALTSIKALFSVSEQVTRKQFKSFNAYVLERIKGIKAIEWIPRVKSSERQYYEENAKKEGLVNFQFQDCKDGKMVPAPERLEYFPVYFVEPMKGNEKALGYDLASDPIRYAALQKSLKLNALVATGRVKLVQEKSAQKGVLIFSPVEIEGKVIGFSLGVYRIKDLVSRALKGMPQNECNFTIFDITAEEGNQLLAQINGEDIPKLPDDALLEQPAGLQYLKKVKIADREWAILITPTKFYLKSFPNPPVWILIVCLILSFAILYSVYQFLLDRQVALNDRKKFKGGVVEDEFLIEMRKLVEENLTDHSFNIKTFAKKAGVSRVQLFRKIKAHSNKSPSVFVRSVRLDHAKKLLLSTDLHISEIAYDVGFNDPAFFTKKFKEAYGLTPSEFRVKELI